MNYTEVEEILIEKNTDEENGAYCVDDGERANEKQRK